MTGIPFGHVVDFWKPRLEAGELESLARHMRPDESLSPGVGIVRSDSEARWYEVVEGESRFLLFAAVHPVPRLRDSALALAEIRDISGEHHSFIEWLPGESCVVLPFDPDAAIEAFRYERYVDEEKRTVLPSGVLSAYYTVRRLLPTSAKMMLRKLISEGAETKAHPLSWPSDDSLDSLMRLLLRVMMLALGRERLDFLWFWPDRHPWAVVLTHDVETAGGLRNVARVMELEVARGLRASFNFVAADYAVPGALLARLKDSGFEIGVHGYTHDGLMFSQWRTLCDRAVAVNECGRRWGASGFRSPATYRNLEWLHMLDFEYDSSVSDTAPHEPQPGGCASRFPYFVGDLVEVPITVPQDHTLFGLLGHRDSLLWRAKLGEIRESNGMACVLTHPDPSAGYIGMPENEALYVEILDIIEASEAWTPLPRELAAWWRSRADVNPFGSDLPESVAIATAVLDPRRGLTLAPPRA